MATWAAGGEFAAVRAGLDDARARLVGAAPLGWRSTAARGFADRLAEHVAACEAVSAAVRDAEAAVRAFEAEAAAAREALSPFVAMGTAAGRGVPGGAGVLGGAGSLDAAGSLDGAGSLDAAGLSGGGSWAWQG